jgi:hypothetical protein
MCIRDSVGSEMCIRDRFRNVQMSWTSGDIASTSPWLRVWQNARKWVA